MKWSSIFVSGTGSARSESEEKASFTTNMAFSSLSVLGLALNILENIDQIVN